MARALPLSRVTQLRSSTTGGANVGNEPGGTSIPLPGSARPNCQATSDARTTPMSMSGSRIFRRFSSRRSADHHQGRARPRATDDQFTALPAVSVSHRRTMRMLMAVAHLLDAEQIGDLAQRHEQAGPRHEAEDDRFRDVARQVAQPEQGDDDLTAAHEQAEQEHRLQGVRGCVVAAQFQAGDGAEDDERNGVGRAVDEVRRGAEDGGDGGHDDGGVEAERRIDAGDEGVGHRLRQRHGGHGEAGDRSRRRPFQP